MANFGKSSSAKLSTCHPDLQKLFKEVVKKFDCAVICGSRGEEDQNRLFHQGKSKLKFPKSNHNAEISNAVDVVPFPIDWGDTKRFCYFSGYVQGIAENMGLKIRWGGDWNRNTILHDQTFDDLPHFELLQERK